MPLNGIANAAPRDVVVDAIAPNNAGAQPVAAANVRHVPPGAQEIRNPAQVRAEARANAPVMDRNLAGVAAPGREGFFSRVGRFFRDLNTRLFGRPFQLPENVRLAMPGGDIDFPSSRLVSMIKALPRRERAEAADSIQQTLQARLDNGRTLLNSIYAGNAELGPSTDNVADVLLFLEAKAIQTGNAFTEGAFNIEDREGKLARWLDSCPERYQRSSSHLENQTRVQVDGHLNTHRGIDIPSGIRGLTSDKTTLLFGTIPADNTLGTERRIFLKMESHGCRLSTLSRGDRVAGLAQGDRADRPVHASDFKTMLGHACSFIATRGQGSAEGSRKERVPDSVKSTYKRLLERAPEGTALGDKLREHDPLNTGSGLRIMTRNLSAAVEAGMDFAAVEREIRAFDDAINAMRDRSHMDVRIGNEVVFDMNELGLG